VKRMDLFAFLDQHKIAYTRVDHAPVFTFAEAEGLLLALDGAHTKNIFLRDRKGRRHFLVVINADHKVDLVKLAQQLGSSRLSMASVQRLQRLLNLTPGSVSLLGVLNDTASEVEVILDEELRGWQHIQCHPLVNDSTLAIPMTDLLRFLDLTAHPPRWIAIPRAAASIDKTR